jgi:hypothetical protein
MWIEGLTEKYKMEKIANAGRNYSINELNNDRRLLRKLI